MVLGIDCIGQERQYERNVRAIASSSESVLGAFEGAALLIRTIQIAHGLPRIVDW